jgi:hypothetical protein
MANPRNAQRSEYEPGQDPGYDYELVYEPLPVSEPVDEPDEESTDLTEVEVKPPEYRFEPPPEVPAEPEPRVRLAELQKFPVSPYATGFYQQQTALAAIAIARNVKKGLAVHVVKQGSLMRKTK